MKKAAVIATMKLLKNRKEFYDEKNLSNGKVDVDRHIQQKRVSKF